ncbi:MAG: CoA pyrophosphatase [Porticoccaceae bacterium]|nr:CoA pyrophosphatase [Porticoccaceae bacterium]
MLETLIQNLNIFPLSRPRPDPLSEATHAAVLILLSGPVNDPVIRLTQRSRYVSHHPGEVAFPGGMWEESDNDLWATALRESEEEIGLKAQSVWPLATMPQASPMHRKVAVTPCVGLLQKDYALIPEPAEIAAIFHIPVSYLLHVNNYGYFTAEHRGKIYTLPHVDYAGYRIWGFTLKVLVDMLNASMASNIDLH